MQFLCCSDLHMDPYKLPNEVQQKTNISVPSIDTVYRIVDVQIYLNLWQILAYNRLTLFYGGEGG